MQAGPYFLVHRLFLAAAQYRCGLDRRQEVDVTQRHPGCAVFINQDLVLLDAVEFGEVISGVAARPER